MWGKFLSKQRSSGCLMLLHVFYVISWASYSGSGGDREESQRADVS